MIELRFAQIFRLRCGYLCPTHRVAAAIVRAASPMSREPVSAMAASVMIMIQKYVPGVAFRLPPSGMYR